MEPRSDWKRLIGQVLSKLKRNANYVYFAEPVDPVKLGIPLYPFLIRKPIDLGTIEMKLSDGAYTSHLDVASDMALCFENALLFNGPPSTASPVFVAAKSMRDCFLATYRAKFDEEPPSPPCLLQCEDPNKRKPGLEVIEMTSERSKLFGEMIQKMVKKFESHIASFVFPVDPVHIQGYYSKVSHPMSLSLVETKLYLNKYQTAEQMANDVHQIWQNCLLFNGESKLSRTAFKLGDKFDKYYLKAREDMKKGKTAKQSRKRKPNLEGSSSPIINIVDRPSVKTPSHPAAAAAATSSTSAAVIAGADSTVTYAPAPPAPVSARPTPKPSGDVASAQLRDRIRPVFQAMMKTDSAKILIESSSTLRKSLRQYKVKLDAGEYKDVRSFVEDAMSAFGVYRNTHQSPEDIRRIQEMESALRDLQDSEVGVPRPLKRQRKTSITLSLPSAAEKSEKPAFNKAGCSVIVDRLYRDSLSELFRHPVGNSVPGYLDIIKHPMDLSTVKSKVSKGRYASNEEFASDLRLIWKNCREFNGDDPITDVSNQLADKFEQLFARVDSLGVTKSSKVAAKTKKTPTAATSASATAATLPPLSKDPSAAMNEASLKKCSDILRRLSKLEMAGDFMMPIDPIAFGYDGYDDVVHRRMDLSTLRNSLQAKKYRTPKEFGSDLSLIFENALAYDGTPLATRIAAQFLLNEARQSVSEAFPGADVSVPQWAPIARKALASIGLYDHGNLFAQPVDPLAYNLLNYYEKVPYAMDLNTVKRKLNAGLYQQQDTFLSDIDRCWQNCIDFHGSENPVLSDVARECREHFNREWERLLKQAAKKLKPKVAKEAVTPKVDKPVKDRTPKKPLTMGCVQILRRLKKMDTLLAFCAPVDLQAYPTYAEFVSEPMDLSTIESQLHQGAFPRSEEFVRKIRLVFENCRRYNLEGSPVRTLGDQLSTWLEPVLQSALEDGRLQASLDEVQAKVAERRSLKASKEQEKEQKKLARLAEKAEKREAKEKQRLEKIAEREQKQKIRAAKQEQKKQVTPSKIPSVSSSRPPTAPSSSGDHRIAASSLRQPSAARAPKPAGGGSGPLEEKDIVKVNPPRPPLTLNQRRLLTAFIRPISSRVAAVGASRVTQEQSKDTSQKKSGSSDKGAATQLAPASGAQSLEQSRQEARSAASNLSMRWKMKRARRGGHRKMVPALLRPKDEDEMDVDDGDAEAWNRKVRTWIKHNQSSGPGSGPTANVAISLSEPQIYRHGCAEVKYAPYLLKSNLDQSSGKLLGFCEHRTLPLWVRCRRHQVSFDHPGSGYKAASVQLDVFRIVLLSQESQTISLTVKVAPLTGVQWQTIAGLKYLLVRADQVMSSRDQFTVLCEPDPGALREVTSTASRLGLPAGVEFEWVNHGFYLSQSTLSSKEPFLSYQIVGLRDTLSVLIAGVDCFDFVETGPDDEPARLPPSILTHH